MVILYPKENWKLNITTILFWTPPFTNESECRRKFRIRKILVTDYYFTYGVFDEKHREIKSISNQILLSDSFFSKKKGHP
jgi:hypothetical protein